MNLLICVLRYSITSTCRCSIVRTPAIAPLHYLGQSDCNSIPGLVGVHSRVHLPEAIDADSRIKGVLPTASILLSLRFYLLWLMDLTCIVWTRKKARRRVLCASQAAIPSRIRQLLTLVTTFVTSVKSYYNFAFTHDELS